MNFRFSETEPEENHLNLIRNKHEIEKGIDFRSLKVETSKKILQTLPLYCILFILHLYSASLTACAFHTRSRLQH